MEKLKRGMTTRIRQKMHMVPALDITLQNSSKHDIEFEVEEKVDGVKPKLLIKIRRLKRKLKKFSYRAKSDE